MKSLLPLIFLVLTACSEQGNQVQNTSSENDQPTEKLSPLGIDAITTDSLTGHIKVLASDEFEGRAPGTVGEEKTINYLAENFKKAGLQPGNGDSYFQKVPLTSVEAVNQPALTIQSSEGEAIVLNYPSDQVIWTRHQTEQVTLNDSQLVFVGYGINAPERNWNDYDGVDVKGKTVVMLVNDPGYATQNPELFNGNAMTYYGRWDYKFDEAARQGAAGAIIIHDTLPAAYPWSTVSSSWTGPKFDIIREDKGESLSIMESWITKDNAKLLFSKSGLDLDAMYEAAKSADFKAVEMNLKASATIQNKVANVESNNVIAILPGSKYPDEVFLYMAHWDHLGKDPSKEGDNIFNGALDNASGTAGLLTMAEAFASLPEKPERSIVFMAVTAEEQGLLGSAHYAANPVYPLANTVAGLNMDVLKNFGRTNDLVVIGLGMSQLDGYLEAKAKSQNRYLKPDAEAQKGYYYRSDHFELAKLGVPMIYPKGGYDHVEKGFEYGMAKAKEYTDNHYHGPSDEYNESWDMTGSVQDLQLYFMVGQDIANSQDWPEWNEGAEFKAARDAQRAGK